MDEPFLILRGGQLYVREAKAERYSVALPGDSVNVSFPESKTRRGRVGHGIAQTLLTGEEQVVVVEERCIQLGTLRGGQWEKTYDECRRYYSPEGISPTLPTKAGGYHEVKIGEIDEGPQEIEETEVRVRIRKLTPRECYRLMGFDDEDYDKASAVCSETQLYKQAGNSIVVNVLEAIFNNLKPYFVDEGR